MMNSAMSEVAMLYFKAAEEYKAKTGKDLGVIAFVNGEY